MMRLFVPLLLSAIVLNACATARAPSRVNAPVREVLERAHGGNWRMRVSADTVYEGRVQFVDRNFARIGERSFGFDRVTQVERSCESHPGGKRTGALVGAGLVIGYLGVAFWESGADANVN